MRGQIPPIKGVGDYNVTEAVLNRIYSPVTLSQEWSKVGRLLLMVIFSTIGSTMNGFFVSAFFVEHTLKKIGNVYLACVGMSDLILTSIVMPTCAVVLLSGQWDSVPLCYALQFLSELATYSYSLFFMLVAAENYYRLCRSPEEYEMFISMRVGLISFFVFAVSVATAGTGVYLDLDYDYCQRKHYGNFYFRVTTAVLFHAIPFIMTMFGLFSASFGIRRKARKQVHYKRSQQYERDYSTALLNITAYILFVVAWIPYLVVVHEFPGTSDSKYYHCVWIGMCRSVFTSFIYGILGRNFRRAFAHLFNYCCCKSTLSGSFNNRHRRALEYKPATGDVRVHIMHQAVHPGSPQRAASSSRETQEL